MSFFALGVNHQTASVELREQIAFNPEKLTQLLEQQGQNQDLNEMPALVSRNFLVPGSIAVVMTIIGAMLTSLVVAREWERGTMEALLATPVTKGELLLSKLLPYSTGIRRSTDRVTCTVVLKPYVQNL